jgi:hypothetical protein
VRINLECAQTPHHRRRPGDESSILPVREPSCTSVKGHIDHAVYIQVKIHALHRPNSQATAAQPQPYHYGYTCAPPVSTCSFAPQSAELFLLQNILTTRDAIRHAEDVDEVVG